MFFVIPKRFRQKFCWCLYLCQLKEVLFLLKMFLSFDPKIVDFFSSFVIKVFFLCLKIFFPRGAYLSSFFENAVSKSSYELIIRWVSRSSKALLNFFELSCLFGLYMMSEQLRLVYVMMIRDIFFKCAR